MTIVWAQAAEIGILVGFHLFILLMLSLDLGVFQRKAHAVTMKEAGTWTAVWVTLAMLFAAGIWQFWDLWHPEKPGQGGQKAVEFVTGYLVEESLSVDNLFVFLVIFRYFAVPAHLQHRLLVWGIIGAVILRATLILVGTVLLYLWWMPYIFGAFLIFTAYKMLRAIEKEVDPGSNPIVRLAKRFLPLVPSYESETFWVRQGGRWFATPLVLVLVAIETTDVVFALDSIPAIFAITKDPFIVYTSNIFAILGLRSLFFLVAGFLGMFRYLNVGLALVLAFVGVKMMTEDLLHPYMEAMGITSQGLILLSLGVIAVILSVAVVASLLAGPEEAPASAAHHMEVPGLVHGPEGLPPPGEEATPPVSNP